MGAVGSSPPISFATSGYRIYVGLPCFVVGEDLFHQELVDLFHRGACCGTGHAVQAIRDLSNAFDLRHQLAMLGAALLAESDLAGFPGGFAPPVS